MIKCTIAIAAVGTLLFLSPQGAPAQASKYLEQKPAGASQQNSWQQVDKINREADGTQARYSQSRESAGLTTKGYTGGKITTSSVFPKSAKPKTTPGKTALAPKKR